MRQPLLAALLFVAVAVNAQPTAPAARTAAASSPNMPKAAMPHDMKHSMMGGMDQMQKMPSSGDVDKDFALMMKMHHQQGVKMAQMELDHGKSEPMKEMARKIIAAQNQEITAFDRWLATQK